MKGSNVSESLTNYRPGITSACLALSKQFEVICSFFSRRHFERDFASSQCLWLFYCCYAIL